MRNRHHLDIRRNEAGQTSIILLLLIFLFLFIAAFSVDGMRVFLHRRTAQSAADGAALAGALALCEGLDPVAPALQRAADNGADAAADPTAVTVNHPPAAGPYQGNRDYVAVTVKVRTGGSLVRLFYSGPLETTARAVGFCQFHRVGGAAALFGDSERCQNTVEWSASDTIVQGGVHSNRDVRISGGSNRIEGPVTFVDGIEAPAGRVNFIPGPPGNPAQIDPQPIPLDYTISDYAPGGPAAALAEAEGRYISSSGSIDASWLVDHGQLEPGTGRLRPGLFYAAGDIDLSSSPLVGEGVTLVAGGQISLRGNEHRLSPYMDGLLLFSGMQRVGGARCNSPVIRLAGSRHFWAGTIYAPKGAVHLDGATAVGVRGGLFADTIRLGGSEIEILHDDSYLKLLPPTLGMAE